MKLYDEIYQILMTCRNIKIGVRLLIPMDFDRFLKEECPEYLPLSLDFKSFCGFKIIKYSSHFTIGE